MDPLTLNPLYQFTAKGAVEKLGAVPDGERVKIEFRGRTEPGSEVAGKVHGTNWILLGPLGRGQVDCMHEISTEDGQRLVVQLRGSATTEMPIQIKACGVVRSGGARFLHLDGHIVVADVTVDGDGVTVRAYHR